jgi:Rap1a immunity proteins
MILFAAAVFMRETIVAAAVVALVILFLMLGLMDENESRTGNVPEIARAALRARRRIARGSGARVARTSGREIQTVIRLTALTLALALPAMPAKAEKPKALTVGILYLECKRAAPGEHHCIGYISGAADMMIPDDMMTRRSCVPASASAGALTQAFTNYAAKHPEHWNMPATVGVMLAIRETWPCH